MKLSLLICIAAPAWAYDDSNLMQHGVSVSAEQREGVQASLRRIQEELDQIPSTGKSRQMAIDALMKSVSEAEAIDEDAKAVLDEIDTLLKNILDQLEGENDVDQDNLNDILSDIPTCNSNGVDDDATAQTAFNEARTDHSECREEERDIWDLERDACNALVLLMTDYLPGAKCVPPILHTDLPFPHDYMSNWNDFVSEGLDHFQDVINDFTPANTKCKGEMSNLANKRNECKGEQGQAENKFCLWKTERESMCTNRQSCWDDKVALHNGRVATIKVTADTRVNEARLIAHVRCLLQNLKAGVLDVDVCKGSTQAAEDSYQEKYNVTYPAIPAIAPCDLDAVSVYPGSDAGSATWQASFFEDFVSPAGQYSQKSPIHPTTTTCG